MLLLDEPLGALDLKLRQQMQIELKRIQREVGITFVYVTHDQEEALTMSDRLAVFNAGRIEQVGAPAEVYERPADEFIAGFVGVSNVLERDGQALHGPAGEDPPGRAATADGLRTETGTVREVAYAGMITRFVVDLDARRRAAGRPAEPRHDLGRGRRAARPRGHDRMARREPATSGGSHEGMSG